MGGELIFTGESGLVQLFAAAHNPVDATTYYLCFSTNMPSTNPNMFKSIFLRPGRIRRVLIGFICGVVASAETGSIYLCVTDANTGVITEYLIDGAVSWSASGGYYYPPQADPESDIGIAPWDSFNIKIVYPTWVTNPTAVTYYGSVSVGP